MRQKLAISFFLLGTLVCFTAYCFALVEWVQDYRTGVYRKHHWEAFYETSALIIYTGLAVRFMIKHINVSQ